MIPTLRTLTRKSKLGFGKHGDMTIQRMIDFNHKDYLVSCYYNLSSINFIEDLLIELKITTNFRIKKPSINKDMYNDFLEKYAMEKQSGGQGADKLKFKTRSIKKSILQGKNHNH